MPDLLNLGNLALGDQHYEEAVGFYERAEAVGSELTRQNQAQFGIALLKIGRAREAIPRLEAGLATMPDQSPLLLEFLGDAYATADETEKAAEAYTRALLFGRTPALLKKLTTLQNRAK